MDGFHWGEISPRNKWEVITYGPLVTYWWRDPPSEVITGIFGEKVRGFKQHFRDEICTKRRDLNEELAFVFLARMPRKFTPQCLALVSARQADTTMRTQAQIAKSAQPQGPWPLQRFPLAHWCRGPLWPSSFLASFWPSQGCHDRQRRQGQHRSGQALMNHPSPKWAAHAWSKSVETRCTHVVRLRLNVGLTLTHPFCMHQQSPTGQQATQTSCYFSW